MDDDGIRTVHVSLSSESICNLLTFLKESWISQMEGSPVSLKEDFIVQKGSINFLWANTGGKVWLPAPFSDQTNYFPLTHPYLSTI
jgi:hypothetical protein